MDQEAILDYWLDIVGPERWYTAEDALDADIRERFYSAWEAARDEQLGYWAADARGALAFIILTDQFPRNMFRADPRAFATDWLGRKAAESALHRGWDMRVPEPERQFFYLPLMHAECQSDQDRCVRLLASRMPQTGAQNLLHARAHREVIRRFGRFPYRNAALGRNTTPAEAAFLDAGGYGALVRELRPA